MYPIRVPALRERRSDVSLLAGFFLDLYRRRLGLGPVRLNEAARKALVAADWRGNVRELDHVLGRAVLRAGADVGRDARVLIGPEHLHLDGEELSVTQFAEDESRAGTDAAMVSGSGMTLKEAVEQTKRVMVLRAVEENGGNWAAAARSLGMARSNLHHMAERLGLRR
jgi:anaerobic nitric oxide reductase transcription regulator